jgi:tetratricopeptide (TPR) repeat protein
MPMTLANFLADVTAVYIGDATGGAFGSGRLIAPGLVLTAGHVVDYPTREAPARTGWKIRLLGERATDGTWTGPPHEAELLWRGPGDLDLALVQIRGDTRPTPSLKAVPASYDQLGMIGEVDAAGFPEAWFTTAGELRDYRVRGSLRLAAQFGPYAWSVPLADKPDEPGGWKGMSGAAVCYAGPDDKLYLFGAVQQVPANFSGGMLEVARVSDSFADADFMSHLQAALGEKPPLVRWVEASYYGFAKAGLTDLLEKLKGGEAIQADWVDRQEKLAERAAVSERALVNIARRLGVENVPTDELGPALIDRIDRLHLAQRRVQALPADNPIKSAAEAAAEDGEYHRAEALLAVALDQIRAVKCIDDGNPDLAIAVLDDAARRLGDISTEGPVDDRIVLGYIYKTYEQAFSAKGDEEQAKRYLAKALAVFQTLAHETIPEGKTAIRFAEVMNGLGNLRAAQGQHREAIGDYQVATSLAPSYAYAWHDMFLSYFGLAKQGEFHVTAMRQALAKTKRTGKGLSTFGPNYFARLDSMMADVEQANRAARSRSRSSRGSDS